MADKRTLEVNEKNLLDPAEIGLANDDLKIVYEVLVVKPLKVQLEVVFNGAKDAISTAAQIFVSKKPAKEVVDRYKSLLAKAAAPALAQVAKSYRDDQAGKKGAYGEAEAVLGKLHKHVENVMDDFRVDLREHLAKKMQISAKQLMTVGHISVKEWPLRVGVFKTEVDFEKPTLTQAETGDDLKSAVKKKQWQYCGVAFADRVGKVAVSAKTKLKLPEVKKHLPALFKEDERNTLKFATGMFYAVSSTNLSFEFKHKKEGNQLPGNDDETRKRLKRGLKEQGFPGHVTVKFVEEYSKKGEKTTPKEKEKEKEKSKEKPTDAKAKSPPTTKDKKDKDKEKEKEKT